MTASKKTKIGVMLAPGLYVDEPTTTTVIIDPLAQRVNSSDVWYNKKTHRTWTQNSVIPDRKKPDGFSLFVTGDTLSFIRVISPRVNKKLISFPLSAILTAFLRLHFPTSPQSHRYTVPTFAVTMMRLKQMPDMQFCEIPSR